MLERVFPRVKTAGIINSISDEGDKCEVLMPILKDNPDWLVVALCCDNKGVAAAEDKIRIACTLVEKASAHGIAPSRLHIDPLVLALSAVNDAALSFCNAIRGIKAKYPDANLTAAASNISFGMPFRSLINKNFLVMAALAGLDSVILDPANRDLMATVYAIEALMGKDRYCRRYNNAYRKGKIGPINS